MQLSKFGAKCAPFLNFILGCGVFAYGGFFRKMFLTFPFGYRVLYKKIGLFCVLFYGTEGAGSKKSHFKVRGEPLALLACVLAYKL